MKTIFVEETNKTILSWCETPEESALEQARNLTHIPFIEDPICLMPDTHCGYGMPIGGVIACRDAIIPNCVGYDVGCGMLAVKTDLTDLDTGRLKVILRDIREQIPVGFNHRKTACLDMMPDMEECPRRILLEEYHNATYQIGTLGGGNHFIEIQKDEDGFIWFMIHSGSRNLGLKVAKHFNELAKELNSRWHVNLDPKFDLAFLPIETNEAKAYLAEMNYCLKFALANRSFMAKIISLILFERAKAICSPAINIHHNYVTIENHHGKNLWIHRKGATSARSGEIGIIPGSQGTASYIVQGKGNPASYQSCSHGAGRRMGRKQAIRELNLENEQRALDEKGILHSVRVKDDLEEAPSAYKDIDVVMSEQKDLVDIVTKLKPLAVVKG